MILDDAGREADFVKKQSARSILPRLLLASLLLQAQRAHADAAADAALDAAVSSAFATGRSSLSKADIATYLAVHHVSGMARVGGSLSGAVCSFGFYRGLADDSTVLIASLDGSGRDFCTEIVAVGRQGGGIWQSSADG